MVMMEAYNVTVFPFGTNGDIPSHHPHPPYSNIGGEEDQQGAGIDDYMEFNTSAMNYPIPLKHLPAWEIGIKVVCYVIIILVALFGNGLVVATVLSNLRMRTTTNFYIVNLAVSDLMVTISCTWVHLVDDVTEGWVLGAFFCKFNSFAQVLSLVASILTLTLISCDRFFGIVFALKARLTQRRWKTFVLLVWIISILISTPLLLYRQQDSRHWADHVEIWCDDIWPVWSPSSSANSSSMFLLPMLQSARTTYYTLVSVVIYFVPIVVMSAAYSVIIWKLWSSQPPGEITDRETNSQMKIKKKVILMLLVILSVFAICWLPFQISILYAEHRAEKHLGLPGWYANFHYFATFLAYSNSAFNPIIYTCFNNSFRKGFRETFRRSFRRRSRASTAFSTYYNTMELKMETIKDNRCNNADNGDAVHL